jgi:hypothetical protein
MERHRLRFDRPRKGFSFLAVIISAIQIMATSAEF